VIDYYYKNNCRYVKIIYNSFKNILSQEIKNDEILPVERRSGIKAEKYEIPFLFEPGKSLILEDLVPRYIKAQIFRILLDSYAAEMAARMAAMEYASKNANEIINNLNLTYNKGRQEQITKELTELVGGAEALKAS